MKVALYQNALQNPWNMSFAFLRRYSTWSYYRRNSWEFCWNLIPYWKGEMFCWCLALVTTQYLMGMLKEFQHCSSIMKYFVLDFWCSLKPLKTLICSFLHHPCPLLVCSYLFGVLPTQTISDNVCEHILLIIKRVALYAPVGRYDGFSKSVMPMWIVKFQ